MDQSSTGSTTVDFSKLHIIGIINESRKEKSITYHVRYGGQDAVLKLEKLAITSDTPDAITRDDGIYQRTFVNDIYSSYNFLPSFKDRKLSEMNVTFICPADSAVMTKYSKSDVILFEETPDTYAAIVEPHIERRLKDPGHIQWVYNILDGLAERERIVFSDPDPETGFILTQDLKWTGDEKDVNLLAISNRHGIRSLRDLDDRHLPLLENIMIKGTKAVRDRHEGQLRSFIHYQPSFYHLHVHFQVVDASAHYATDRDHLLATVINNITLNQDYYKKSTLSYPLKKSSSLYADLKEAERCA